MQAVNFIFTINNVLQVACVFIAQTYNIDLGFGGLITTAITATLAAVGAAGQQTELLGKSN